MSTLTLTANDCQRLIPLLENASREVEAMLEPNAMIQPDTVTGGMHLLESRDWAIGLLRRIEDVIDAL